VTAAGCCDKRSSCSSTSGPYLSVVSAETTTTTKSFACIKHLQNINITYIVNNGGLWHTLRMKLCSFKHSGRLHKCVYELFCRILMNFCPAAT